MKLKITRENIKEWGVALGALLLGALAIWWLVERNSSPLGDEGQGDQNKKGAITEGLKDGKDYGTDYADKEKATFEALVVLRDQHYNNEAEDRKSALKRGDVLAVRKRPHLWSETERASYLVVPIEMTGEQANALIAPKREGDTIVLARKESIDLEKIGFTDNQVMNGQPVESKVFDTGIIREK